PSQNCQRALKWCRNCQTTTQAWVIPRSMFGGTMTTSPETRDSLRGLFHEMHETHARMTNYLAQLQQKTSPGDPALLMDAIYALKQAHKCIDDIRKEINKSLERLQKLGCLAMVQNPEARLEGEWATGSP